MALRGLKAASTHHLLAVEEGDALGEHRGVDENVGTSLSERTDYEGCQPGGTKLVALAERREGVVGAPGTYQSSEAFEARVRVTYLYVSSR